MRNHNFFLQYFILLALMMGSFYQGLTQTNNTVITWIDGKMEPVKKEKEAYAKEERWLENGQWKARLIVLQSNITLAEYGYADSTRNALHGKYIGYYINRKKKNEYNYNMGVIDGPFTLWSPEGILARKGNMKGELLWGDVVLNDVDGKLKASFHTDDRGNGEGKEYLYKTGLTGEGEVKAGKQDGLWVYTDTAQRKVMEVMYNEKGIVTETCFTAESKAIDTGKCISDQPASYPGGPDALRRYLEKNLRYPKSSRYDEIQGTVIVKFVVKTDGSVTAIKVLDSPDTLLSQEARRVIEESGKWIPAIEANQVVPFTHLQNISFRLQ